MELGLNFKFNSPTVLCAYASFTKTIRYYLYFMFCNINQQIMLQYRVDFGGNIGCVLNSGVFYGSANSNCYVYHSANSEYGHIF